MHAPNVTALVLALTIACSGGAVSGQETAQSRRFFSAGFSPFQPEQSKVAGGTAVKVTGGWLIPYTDRIAGTDESIFMVPVPGGRVQVPAPPSGQGEASSTSSKSYPRWVEVEAFWMSATEITMRQYMPYRQLYFEERERRYEQLRNPRNRRNQDNSNDLKLTDADGVTAPSDIYDPDYNFEYAGETNSAAVTISQFAARQYTKWISVLNNRLYRLPTRSEHIHACRIGEIPHPDPTTFKHPFDIDSRVADGKPNRLGIFDLRGNVAEWVIEENLPPVHQEHVVMGDFAGDGWLEACDCDDATRSDGDWWDIDPDFPKSPHWATSEEARQTGFRIIRPFGELEKEEWARFHDPDTEDLVFDVLSQLESGRNVIVQVKSPDQTNSNHSEK